MPSSALIVNAYSYRNAGDAAIMLSTAKLLREGGIDSVTLSTRYTEDRDEYTKWQIHTVPPVVAFETRQSAPSWARALGLLFAAIPAVFFASFPGSIRHSPRCRALVARLLPALAPMLTADLVVIAGGGYLYSSKRRVNLSLVHSCLAIWLAGQLGRRVSMMPASIGPVYRRLDQWLIATCLRKIVVVVREFDSLDACKYRPRLASPLLVPDVAFLGLPTLATKDASEAGPAKAGRRLVRIVAMNWSWSSSVDPGAERRYISALAAVCDRLRTAGYEVVLGGHSALPEHEQDDITVCEKISGAALMPVDIDRNCAVDHLAASYAQCHVVIGTRLHACIMAIAAGTPAVALAYQEKSIGVARGLGGAIKVFRVDDLDPVAVCAAVDATDRDAAARVGARSANAIRTGYAVCAAAS